MPEDLLCDSKFEVGDTEKHRVKFHRDPWFARMAVTVNGEEVSLLGPWSPAAHFTFRKSVKRHEFTVGKEEVANGTSRPPERACCLRSGATLHTTHTCVTMGYGHHNPQPR